MSAMAAWFNSKVYTLEVTGVDSTPASATGARACQSATSVTELLLNASAWVQAAHVRNTFHSTSVIWSAYAGQRAVAGVDFVGESKGTSELDRRVLERVTKTTITSAYPSMVLTKTDS